MRLAAESGIVSGESGAAGLGGLLGLIHGEEARQTLGVNADTRVLVFNSEGATDPDAYRKVVSGSQTGPAP
jgi:diaminopropionate ammonia-lyase